MEFKSLHLQKIAIKSGAGKATPAALFPTTMLNDRGNTKGRVLLDVTSTDPSNSTSDQDPFTTMTNPDKMV